jgi:hypothetical protein
VICGWAASGNGAAAAVLNRIGPVPGVFELAEQLADLPSRNPASRDRDEFTLGFDAQSVLRCDTWIALNRFDRMTAY